MKIAIHQPEHIPWLGFFHKISQVHAFVILDNVQFRKNYFQNRNRIRTSHDWLWVTVPVRHNLDTLIKDVVVSSDKRWKNKWRDSIYFAYRKAKYFDRYAEGLLEAINLNLCNISELNIYLIKLLAEFLGVKPKIFIASQLSAKGKGGELLLNICKELSADTYLSGVSGKEYLNFDDFKKAGIKVEFQQFHHPIYKQLYEPFIPCMSVIDLLFNHGGKGLEIISGIGTPVMEKVFF